MIPTMTKTIAAGACRSFLKNDGHDFYVLRFTFYSSKSCNFTNIILWHDGLYCYFDYPNFLSRAES